MTPAKPTTISSPQATKRRDAARAQAIRFLQCVGLDVRPGRTAGGFLQGVRIEAGALVYDESASASNLLHEAGHVAICPGRFRHLLSGDLEPAFAKILSAASLRNEDPDGPLYRAVIQMSDPEATAWAFAAGVAAGLPRELIIEDVDYDGEGPSVRLALVASRYLGVNGLQHAGMTTMRDSTRYPSMVRWLQID